MEVQGKINSIKGTGRLYGSSILCGNKGAGVYRNNHGARSRNAITR